MDDCGEPDRLGTGVNVILMDGSAAHGRRGMPGLPRHALAISAQRLQLAGMSVRPETAGESG